MNVQITNSACVVCKARHIHYVFSLEEHRIVRCNECGFMFINPQPSDEALSRIYGNDYFVLSDNQQGLDHVSDLKKSTANKYIDLLFAEDALTKSPLQGKTLLEIGCGDGDFLEAAASRGLHVTGIEYSPYACDKARAKIKNSSGEIIQGEIEALTGRKESFDYIVFCDLLEHVRDPRGFLKTVFELLKPDGVIFCAVPSLDSWSAKLLKTDWMEFKLEHLWYFNTKNLRSLFFQENFSNFKQFPAKKTLSIAYIAAHFDKHPVPLWSLLVKLVRAVLPNRLRTQPFQITASGIGITAKKQRPCKEHCLSVVMPAYNEAATIKAGIERVLNKTIEGMRIELIIVESNSNDGTKEIIAQYQDRPDVKVIFEDKASGKGHAVRAGFKAATGDFILIQDADDEYDIDDYDALLEPLRDGREAFVLGARHGGSAWKMRTFSDQPIHAFILNFGHWVFASLLNLLYGVWLKDPFTMYKVFRRDCIEGIEFECNRFDFDYELVIKLIRSGYTPIEIPVNYRSRSFLDGKKVRMFADPVTWLIALIKFRFTKV
jgi:2-polyprenyl-3-methyl-5-hydroxy-6-metoxy-1,4-benzoquinol methylase